MVDRDPASLSMSSLPIEGIRIPRVRPRPLFNPALKILNKAGLVYQLTTREPTGNHWRYPLYPIRNVQYLGQATDRRYRQGDRRMVHLEHLR